jgi:RNA polymerase sigma-70 factor (ECF subfamily)
VTPVTDTQRFEAIYRAHYGALVRFVHRRSDAASAEEIVADTFAIAWRRLDDVPADPLPWLYVVARNLLYAERRAAGRARETAEGAARVASTSRDPADALAERDSALRAFASLSEPDREVLRLLAWEGLSHRDAARVLRTSRVAFSMRASRARRRLAAALADPSPTMTPIPEGRP